MFYQKHSITLQRPLFLILVFATLLGMTLFMAQPTSAKPLGIILQTNNLPPDSQVLIDSDLKPDEPSHPLYKSVSGGRASGLEKLSADDQAFVVNYDSARVLSVLVPTNGVVMNFSYQFKTGKEAQKAAQIIRDDIAKSPKLAEVRKLRGGRGYILNGDESDSIYWFVGTRGNSLSLVLVNGIGKEEVSSLFGITVQDLANQSIDSVPDSVQ
jgi:hypothetical protein